MAAASGGLEAAGVRIADRVRSRLAGILAGVHPEVWIFAAATLLLNLHSVPGLSRFAPEPPSPRPSCRTA